MSSSAFFLGHDSRCNGACGRLGLGILRVEIGDRLEYGGLQLRGFTAEHHATAGDESVEVGGKGDKMRVDCVCTRYLGAISILAGMSCVHGKAAKGCAKGGGRFRIFMPWLLDDSPRVLHSMEHDCCDEGRGPFEITVHVHDKHYCTHKINQV